MHTCILKKSLPNINDFRLLQDSGRSQSGTKTRKAKSKSKSDSSHINIKNSPILLRDGDIIGVKVRDNK